MMATGEFFNPVDHGEWLNFGLPIVGGTIPVRIGREAMEDHFGALQEPQSLMRAYVRRSDEIHKRVFQKVVAGIVYTVENPLIVRTQDF